MVTSLPINYKSKVCLINNDYQKFYANKMVHCNIIKGKKEIPQFTMITI